MKKIDKIKEWVLVNYRKTVVQALFDLKMSNINDEFLLISKKEYYKNFNHSYEKTIIKKIINEIDEKFELTEEEMDKMSFFVRKYIMLIINKYDNLVNENKKQESEV